MRARVLSDEERRALNARAAAYPAKFVLVDVRPGHAGGDYPPFGAFKLRSFNAMLASLAAGDRHDRFRPGVPTAGAHSPSGRHNRALAPASAERLSQLAGWRLGFYI